MIHLDNKISFIGGFIFTAATSITMMGLIQAAAIGLIGGFFGLLGKELFYYSKDKIKSAKFKVQIIGLYDKLNSKIQSLLKWW